MNRIAAQGKQCSAKAKSTGEQCQNAAIRGYAVCGSHGVGRPKNTGRPGGAPLKHGRSSHRYQSLISDKRAKQFRQAIEDPELLALLPRIAALDTRFQDLWQSLGSKESGEAWKRLKELSLKANEVLKRPSDAPEAQASKNRQFTSLWTEINKLIRDGLSDYYEWVEIRNLIEDTRRLIETESKRIKMMAEIITHQDAKILVERLLTHAQKRMEPNQFAALVYDLEQDLVQTFHQNGEI